MAAGSAGITRTATADGRFGYTEGGDASGTTIVFIHGIGGRAEVFDPQMAAFAPDFHVISWDVPGYGTSAPLETATLPTLAAALGDFLSAIDARDAILVGQSLGGMIVQEAMAAGLVSPKAIVLTGTSPAFGRPDGDFQKKFIEGRLAPLDAGRTMAELADGMMKGLTGPNPDPEGFRIGRDALAATPEESFRAMVYALVDFDQRANLPNISVPALLIAGTEDTSAPPQVMQKMADKIATATYVQLDGAGHLANLDQPDAFTEAMRDFLAGHDSVHA
ncbi:alpha/beta fold hydrolase [Amorphus orientalis]|uniref:3-oxoadipate enol-lactonase n=1 Tax=Amorphus orientalis TaxID=649198 RepID=A0AAE3VSM9_9HYPH|nr:alpha/beta hydrolase [Amorphus orientalis]MDQ0317674.1 3-oxoadipate enol-lactonase [Amorphus orientalis]